MKYKNILSIIFLASFFVLASPARAIEYGMLGGKPANPDPAIENSSSWFIYNLKPGESREDALQVMNLFDEELDVVVYAADTIKSSSGGFALRQFAEPNQEVGNWVKFYPETIPASLQGVFEAKGKRIIDFCQISKEDLEKEIGVKNFSEEIFGEFTSWCQGKNTVEKKFSAKEKMLIPFVFSMPDSADVGEHTGGIMIQKKATEDVAANQGSSVKLTTRVGVRIYETVPGEIVKKLSIEDFRIVKNFSEFSFSDWFGELKKPKEYLVETVVRNDGNVSIEHESNLVIKNIVSGKIENVERKFQALKGDKFVANFTWNKPLLGYYSFQSEVKYQDGNGVVVLPSAPVKLLIVPWREITLLVAFFAIIAVAYVAWKRTYKKKYGGIGWVSYVVKKTDTVATLSEKYQVDWKVLVRTNKIRAPYLLKTGDVILVPAGSDDGKKGRANAKKKVGKIDITAEPSKEVSGKKNSLKAEKSKDIVRLAKKKKPQPEIEMMPAWLNSKKSLLIMAAVAVGVIILSLVIASVISSRAEKKAQMEEKISLVAALQADVAEEKVVANEPENKIEPAEAEAMDGHNVSVKILNGGAAAGTAGKLKTALTDAGYLKIETANAEQDDHQGQAVYYQGDLLKQAEEIQKTLEASYPDMAVKTGVSSEEKSSDIVIMLGK